MKVGRARPEDAHPRRGRSRRSVRRVASATSSVAALTAFALALAACRSSGSTEGSPSPSPSAQTSASAAPTSSGPVASSTSSSSAAAITATGDGGAPSAPRCRVMSSDEGPSPNADVSTWLTLAKKGSFSVKNLDTGRELRFEGPGRFEPCGSDVALVAEGAAMSLPGAGETPGREQWVATPCGAARWSTGVTRVRVDGDVCTLHISMGKARIWTSPDARVAVVGEADAGVSGATPPASSGDAPKAPTPSTKGASDGFAAYAQGTTLRLTVGSSSVASVREGVGECERRAQSVIELRDEIMGAAKTGSPLGGLAMRSVLARGAARAACAVARARLWHTRPSPAPSEDAGAGARPPTKAGDSDAFAAEASRLEAAAALLREDDEGTTPAGPR